MITPWMRREVCLVWLVAHQWWAVNPLSHYTLHIFPLCANSERAPSP